MLRIFLQCFDRDPHGINLTSFVLLQEILWKTDTQYKVLE